MPRWFSVAVLAATLAVLVSPTASPAADPDAPAGAPPNWLPNEPWVKERWLPFNEATMLRLLHTDVGDVQRGIAGGRSLSDFAVQRGIDPDTVIRQLVAPWQRWDPGRRAVMEERARRVFTQPHLSVHMLFHYSHIAELLARWPRIFGVSVRQTYSEMSAGGLCYLQVGIRHRGSARLVRRDFVRALRRDARAGVRRREVLPSEARLFVATQRRLMKGFLNWKPASTH